MERDGISEDEAQEIFDFAQMEAEVCVEEGDYNGLEDIMLEHFGLEPDYIFDLIEM